MAISLNNHESRIKALENKQISNQTIIKKIFNGNTTGGNITLSESANNFDLMIVLGLSDMRDFGNFFISPTKINPNVKRWRIWLDDARCWEAQWNSDRTQLITGHENAVIHSIYGIKFPNTLYNLYYKLYSLIKIINRFFKEVIS